MKTVESSQKFSIGQIKEISLPQNWIKVNEQNCEEDLVVFTNSDDVATQIGFYYRGKPISHSEGRVLEQCLQKEQILSLDNLDSLKSVLADFSYAEKFLLQSIVTSNLNGRIVLIVQGAWMKSQSLNYEILINASGDGTVVQQVFFKAPADVFTRQLPAIKQIFDTIVWI